ncbi:hypothetical protein IW262DRAFT_1458086 [Armillaria fumosa]|nr:hypothetical protein IW262DRAFT_1458086 [Armillaria fumosa]
MTSPQVALLVIASRLLLSLANIHDGLSGYHPLDRLGRCMQDQTWSLLLLSCCTSIDDMPEYGYGILGGEMCSTQTRVVCNCNPMIYASFGIQRLHWYRRRRRNGPYEPCRIAGPSHRPALNIALIEAALSINQLPQTTMAFNLPLDLDTLIVVHTSPTLPSSILKLGSVSHSLRYLS